MPLVNAVAGFDITEEEYVKMGERVNNATRAFWFREIPDFDKKHDALPYRCLHGLMPERLTKGKTVPLEPMAAGETPTASLPGRSSRS